MVRHSKLISLFSIVLIALLNAGSSQAGFTFCKQQSARYIDPESGLIFSFKPSNENSAFLQEFSLGSEKSDVTLDGFITLQGEPLRPVAYAIHQCPDGDVTGEELAKCTIWQGVLYGRYSDGDIGLLPDNDQLPVTQILLPDFARSVMSKPIWNEMNIDQEPFEVFDLLDCGAKK